MLNPLSLEKNHTINNLTLLDDNDARNSTSYSNNLSWRALLTKKKYAN